MSLSIPLEISLGTQHLSLQVTFLTLPDELLYEILNLLDWKGLLAIKSTCKRIHVIAKSHFFWASKASELSFTSSSPVLEAPVESHSVEELEQKVIRRLRTQEKWRNPNPTTFQRVTVDAMTEGRLHLLPGGRWMLDNIAGHVYVLDLDNPELEPQALFEERHRLWNGRVLDPLSGYAIWIDSSKPWLSIRIALHNDTPFAYFGPSRICVYQLDLNGRGADATWDVKPLVTLMCPGPCFKKNLKVDGDYVIERCLYKDGDTETRKIHVFRYSGTIPRVLEWVFPTAATMILLPGNRILAISEFDPRADFYAINTPDGSRSLSMDLLFRIPLHSSPTLSISRVHVDRQFSYIMTTCKDSFDALQIPHEAKVSPVVKRFRRDETDDDYLSLGFSVMVALREDRSMDCTTYDLGDRDDEIRVESNAQMDIFPGSGFLRFVACDEGSGRIVMCNHRTYFFFDI